MSFMIGFLCGGLVTFVGVLVGFVGVLVGLVMYLEREEANEE